MTLSEDITADLSIFFDDEEFAETAIYNGTEITVVEDGGFKNISGSPGVYVSALTIHVRESEVAKPKVGTLVVFRGENYNVGDNPQYDGGIWTLSLDHATSQQISV